MKLDFNKTRRRGLLARFQAVPAFGAAFVLLLLYGCPQKKADERIELGSYAQWERTTNIELDFPIPGHENHYRRIFINKIGADYRKTGNRGDYPDGTIVVKEIYEGLNDPEEGAKPIKLNIMVKDRRSEDARGGWKWIIRDEASGKDTAFKGDFCAFCHAEASKPHPYSDKNPKSENRDFLFY